MRGVNGKYHPYQVIDNIFHGVVEEFENPGVFRVEARGTVKQESFSDYCSRDNNKKDNKRGIQNAFFNLSFTMEEIIKSQEATENGKTCTLCEHRSDKENQREEKPEGQDSSIIFHFVF